MSRIISVKRVANNGLQAEIVEKVQTRKNLLQLLNKGDSRFDVGKERHAWFPVTTQSLSELGFTDEDLTMIEKLEYGEGIEVNYENPNFDGDSLHIQITETTIPSDYQRENVLKAAKQLTITPQVAKSRGIPSDMIGKQGYFFTAEGAHIFQNSTVAFKSQLNHVVIDKAVIIPAPMMADFGAYLAESVSVAHEETKVNS